MIYETFALTVLVLIIVLLIAGTFIAYHLSIIRSNQKKYGQDTSLLYDAIKELNNNIIDSDKSFNENFKTIGSKLIVLEDRQVTMKDQNNIIIKGLEDYRDKVDSLVNRNKKHHNKPYKTRFNNRNDNRRDD